MTPREIIYWAFGEVVASKSEPSEIDYKDCLRYLNRMMSKLTSIGVDVGYTSVGIDDNITCPYPLRLAIIKSLAGTIWPQYSIGPMNRLLKIQAKRGLDTLRSYAITMDVGQYPASVPVGSGNEVCGYDDRYYDETPDDGYYIGKEDD